MNCIESIVKQRRTEPLYDGTAFFRGVAMVKTTRLNGISVPEMNQKSHAFGTRVCA